MANPNSEARLGYSTKLKMGDGGSPENFTEIGEVGDLEIGDSIEQIEVTNHQSPGGRKEYIAALKDGSEVSIVVNYIPSNATHNRATGLRGKQGEVVNFQLIAPGETEVYNFSALVLGVSRSFPVQGVMQMTVSVKLTGADSYTAIP